MAKYVPPFRKGAPDSFAKESSDCFRKGAPDSFAKETLKETKETREEKKPNFSQRDTPRWQETKEKRVERVEPVEQVESVAAAMDNITLNDFPALPRSKTQPLKAKEPIIQRRQTYAELASTWAEQVKANEDKAKKEAEEEADRQRWRAKEAEVKVITRQAFVAKKKTDSDDDLEIDIGCNQSDHSEQAAPSDPEDDYVEEEEEEFVEEDPDAFWTQRKHKGDMY
jgi:hypothetical protein